MLLLPASCWPHAAEGHHIPLPSSALACLLPCISLPHPCRTSRWQSGWCCWRRTAWTAPPGRRRRPAGRCQPGGATWGSPSWCRPATPPWRQVDGGLPAALRLMAAACQCVQPAGQGHLRLTPAACLPACLPAGATVHGLFTVPQSKKRRREDSQLQQAAAALAAAPPAVANGAAIDKEPGQLDAANPVDVGTVEDAVGDAAAEVAGGDTPAAAGPAAKRRKLASSDDVGSGVAPQLAEGTEAAAEAPSDALVTVQQQGQPHAVAAGGGAAGLALPQPSHYVLSLDQLQEHKYPLPRFDEVAGEMVCPEGFVATTTCKGGWVGGRASCWVWYGGWHGWQLAGGPARPVGGWLAGTAHACMPAFNTGALSASLTPSLPCMLQWLACPCRRSMPRPGGG
jgi:hypothetical protein